MYSEHLPQVLHLEDHPADVDAPDEGDVGAHYKSISPEGVLALASSGR